MPDTALRRLLPFLLRHQPYIRVAGDERYPPVIRDAAHRIFHEWQWLQADHSPYAPEGVIFN